MALKIKSSVSFRHFHPYAFSKYSIRLCCVLLFSIYALKHIFTIHFQEHIVLSNPKTIEGVEHCGKDSCCPSSSPLNVEPVLEDGPLTYTDILLKNGHVCNGGWSPKDCESIQTVAILIPYRQRDRDLRLLLARLHSLLQHQNIAYHIFLIEQTGNLPFNRGVLLNLGILYSLQVNPTTDCFIFHDVDLLPENSANLYLCDDNLRHLSSAIDDFRYHPPFDNYAGGVTALSKTNVFKINGFPTRFWGWGSEDDELAARALAYNLRLSRPSGTIGRYKATRHIKSSPSLGHQEEFRQFRNYLEDGLEKLQTTVYNSLNNSFVSITRAQIPHSPVLRIPSTFNECVLLNLFKVLHSNQSVVLVDEKSEKRCSEEYLEEFARTQLFTHIVVDPIKLPKLIGTKNSDKEESLLWYLRFYGWL